MNSIKISYPGKICAFCKEEKPLSSFGKNSSQKDLHHYYCKSWVKNIREANKESNPEYFKNYREKNKEKLRDYFKDYRKKNSATYDEDQSSKNEDDKDKKRRKQKEKSKNPDY